MRPLRVRVLWVLAGGLVLAGCSAKDRPVEARLERASELLRHGRTAQAHRQIEVAIDANPSRSETYWAALGIYLEHKRNSEAVDVVERLLGTDRENKLDKKLSRAELALLYVTLGQTYQEMHRLDHAEQAYKAALALAPGSAQLLNALAYFYADEGAKLDQGLVLAKRAVALAPEDGAIVDTLGWAEYKLGRYDAAVGTLARAVRLMPDDATLRYHLGAAHAKRGGIPEAGIELGKALLLDSGTPQAAKLLKSLHK